MPILSQAPQEQYPPQQPIFPQIDSGLQPSPPQEDFFRYRISGSDILEDLRHQLKGEIKINGKYKVVFDRWMNDEGINKILHISYSAGLNRNIYLGNLTHDQINSRCRNLWCEIARLLTFKEDYEKWDIKKDDRDIIIKTTVYLIHSGLSRSEEGKEADQLSTTVQRQEISHEGLQKPKSVLNPTGWFGKNK